MGRFPTFPQLQWDRWIVGVDQGNCAVSQSDMNRKQRKPTIYKFHQMSPPSELDITQLSPDKKGLSKLVMKNRSAGRKSMSLIHCIPKFSKVLPAKQMSEARKALLTKIKSKQNDNEEEYPYMSGHSDIKVEENYQNFLSPELTIEPVRKKPRPSQEYSECDQPEITIIPKYPQLLPTAPPSQQSLISTMQLLALKKEDYEKLLPTNPIFSSYIFLPSLNLFVHPLVFPAQLLNLAPPPLPIQPLVSPVLSEHHPHHPHHPHYDVTEQGNSSNFKDSRATKGQLLLKNSRSTREGSTFCTLKNLSH